MGYLIGVLIGIGLGAMLGWVSGPREAILVFGLGLVTTLLVGGAIHALVLALERRRGYKRADLTNE